jgi:hypothetical protein
MPSTQLFTQSGGIGLVSGNIFSGSNVRLNSVKLKLSATASGSIYVGVPNLSGDVVTGASGGVLSSGGMADGFELSPGSTHDIESVRLIIPAAVSGTGRLSWEWS